jgi:IclR family transcriptional regulator, pca regulon regulatory protein
VVQLAYTLCKLAGVPADRPRYVIQSLARGLALLDRVRSSPAPLSLVELSEHVGLGLVTTFRLMHTLEHAGYVRRDAQTRRYQLAGGATDLRGWSPSLFDYVQAATPYLEELRSKGCDGVGLGVLEGTHVRNLTRLFYSRLMADSLRPGSLLPAHATSLGKVLLGSLGEAQVRQLYDGRPLERCTPYTICSVDRLLIDVSRAKRLGFAISVNEHAMGVRSVAAPVKDAYGGVIAGITIFTTAPTVTRRSLADDYAPLAVMAADATSARLAAMVDRSKPAAV